MNTTTQCNNCGHRRGANTAVEHCYMFKEAPTETCHQHTGLQPTRSITETFNLLNRLLIASCQQVGR